MTETTDYTDVHGQSTGSGGDQGWFAYQNAVFQTQPVGTIRRPNPVVTAAGTLSCSSV